jgi:hypothetical protein
MWRGGANGTATGVRSGARAFLPGSTGTWRDPPD